MNNPVQEMIDALNAAEPRDIPDDYADTEKMIGTAYKLAVEYLVGQPKDRELIPTWAMLTGKGHVTLVATPFNGANSKDLAALAMRKMMREANVVRYTFMTEAWMARVEQEELDAGDVKPPSERDDRTEIVLIVGADKSGQTVKAFEIIRDYDTGGVTDLKPLSKAETMSSFGGRFANMLSEEVD